MKEFIDKIIENLEIEFNKNNLSSSAFTGQTQQDIKMANTKVKNPNDYINIKNTKPFTNNEDACCTNEFYKPHKPHNPHKPHKPHNPHKLNENNNLTQTVTENINKAI
jgi:hypothetical protein